METVRLFIAVVAVISIFNVVVHAGRLNDERVSDLLSLQANSKDGVIRLNDEGLRRFIVPTTEPRPYSLIIFFYAVQMRGNKELKLDYLRSEFGLVASSYAKNNPDGSRGHAKVFFADVEFADARGSFEAFKVQTLPNIQHLPPGDGMLDEAEAMDRGAFQRAGDGIVSFVEAETKQSVGPIERPPPFSRKQMIVLIGGLLVASPFVIKRIMAKDTLIHEPMFWCFNAILVYFFSVSGGMHNIIRGTPFIMYPSPGQIQFFYQGSGMQLGAEGFAVGVLYLTVGLLLAFVTHLLPQHRSKTAQRFYMLVVMAVSFLAVWKVISLDNWKTGYRIHAYWPNSWR